MKIRIITLHSPTNCGSALQGFALYSFLNKRCIGDDVKLIDYVPTYNEAEGSALRVNARKILFWIPYQKRKRNFSDFMSRNCRFTKRYNDYDELRSNPPEADVYISGSDQIWNPCFNCGKDPAYYLKFVTSGVKLSYASSLGTAKLSMEQLKKIASDVHDFKFVSVRENCSVSQLENAGLSKVQWVCDPTLLLSAAEYSELAADYKSIGKYVAVYLVEHSPLLDEMLDKFRKMGYKIVGVGGYLKKYRCDIHIMDAGPSDFLGLIRDAQFVVATSFHATVFSLIFHKQFAIIPPRMNPERVEQLLEYVDLRDRIIARSSEIENAQHVIDYNIVQRKIDELRADSERKLLTAIEKWR